MIGALSGKVILKRHNSIILMVNGVGYLVYVSQSTLDKLTPKKEILLYIYTHVREDTLNLFGFTQVSELEMFEFLISVSGIGPKTAMLVIDRGVENIKHAIIKADVAFFTSIPRLGKKNSQKLIIELKSKLGSLIDLDLKEDLSGETQEVIVALKQIGFTQKEVLEAVKKLPGNLTLEQKIRESLKILGKN